jgi:hypothetical protein
MAEWSGWKPFEVENRREDLGLMNDGSRHPGRHVSGIIRRCKVAVGENVGGIPGEPEWLRAQVGFLWEFALELMAAGVSRAEAVEVAWMRHMAACRGDVAKQITVELDNIHGTPDGRLGPNMESYKCTWRSFRGAGPDLANFEDKFWTWHMQEKAYLKMWNAQHPEDQLFSCRWIVLWVCGDYNRPIGPKAMECTVTWTPEELDSNWDAMMAHADEMDEEEQE